MRKDGGIDNSVYIFIGIMLLLGLMLLVVRWAITPNCPAEITIEVRPIESKVSYELEMIRFSTDVEARSYAWDFGDGLGFSNDKSYAYNYRTPGTYKVKLLINGECTHEKEIQILAKRSREEEKPIDETPIAKDLAQISAPSKVFFGDVVTFDDISGLGKSWDWNFGDGKRSQEKSPKHKFSATGRYTVRVRINDGLDYAEHAIEVERKPQQQPQQTQQPRPPSPSPQTQQAAPAPIRSKKEVDINEQKFIKMLKDFASGKIKRNDFKPILDQANGFDFSSDIMVDGKKEQFSSYLTSISLVGACDAKKVRLETSEKGYVSGIHITN